MAFLSTMFFPSAQCWIWSFWRSKRDLLPLSKLIVDLQAAVDEVSNFYVQIGYYLLVDGSHVSSLIKFHLEYQAAYRIAA